MAERQAELRRRIAKQRLAAKQPMQSESELRAIPPGTTVAVHLLRSASKSKPEHRKQLAALGLLEGQPRGKKRRINPGHIGKSRQLHWDPTQASSVNQDITRYVFFDPGDEVLRSIDPALAKRRTHLSIVDGGTPGTPDAKHEPVPSRGPEKPMSIGYYEASGGKSATIRLAEGDAMRIEAQDGGYGISWATRLGAFDALRALRQVLPDTPVTEGSFVAFSAGRTEALTDDNLGTFIEDPPHDPVARVHLRFGNRVFTWTDHPVDSSEGHELGIGGPDQTFDLALVKSLLGATATQTLKAHQGKLERHAHKLLAAYG